MESLEPESTAKSSNNSHTDLQEDNWQNLDIEEADNQNDHRTANQAEGKVSSEAVPNILKQSDRKLSEHIVHKTSDLQPSHHDNVADHRTADWVDQMMSEQMDSKSSHQTDHVESEQTDSQMPVLYEQRTSGHIEHRLSSQDEKRASGQFDRRMSSLGERRVYNQVDGGLYTSSTRRASEQTDYRISGQARRRTSVQIDSRLSGLVEQKTYNHGLSDKTGYKTLVKTHHIVHDQASEQAEHQAADQTDSSDHHLTVDYSDSDQADDLIYEKADDTEYNWFDYGEHDQYGSRIFISKEDRDASFRVQPSKFEVSQTGFNNSKVSLITDTESGNFPQAFNSVGTKFVSNFQAQDTGFCPRFPAISTKLDYINSQETSQVIETKPDDISEYQEGKSSHGYNETYRRRFPSIVYQDPYQISLQYMEKHRILQIFQITENLVYERPEDPLSFMLYQVQEMIKNRDERATYKE